MKETNTDWGRSDLGDHITCQISIDDGLKFGFPGDQNEALRRFGGIENPHSSPIVGVRGYDKDGEKLRELFETLQSYRKNDVSVGGVVLAVPTFLDKGGVTRKAFFEVQTEIQSALPNSPVLLVEHEQQDRQGNQVNTFDAPLNIITAMTLALREKFGIESDMPLWFHSFGPQLKPSELAKVQESLKHSPFFLSARVPHEDLILPPDVSQAIGAIRASLGCLPKKLSKRRIPSLKQYFRNTCTSWSLDALEEVGGFNPLFGGGPISVDYLPKNLKIDDRFDGLVLAVAGEEDTDAFMRMVSQSVEVRKKFMYLLDNPNLLVKYFDPDVKRGTEKARRAWGPEPHPAHYYMFPRLAKTREQEAGIALREKMGHYVPENFRGVHFVSRA